MLRRHDTAAPDTASDTAPNTTTDTATDTATDSSPDNNPPKCCADEPVSDGCRSVCRRAPLRRL